MMEIGVQAYAIRKALLQDPVLALLDLPADTFIELAGPGQRTYKDLIDSIAFYEQTYPDHSSLPKILGAHVCPVAISGDVDDKDVQELIRMHVDAIPSLRWLGFTLNPADIEEIELDKKSRKKVFSKYAKALDRHASFVKTAWPQRNLAVVYHAYCHDFLAVTEGIPGALYIAKITRLSRRPLQLDTYFSGMAGVSALKFIRDYGDCVHSIHANSWDKQYRQCKLESGIIERSCWQTLINEAKNKEIGYVIVEHDTNCKEVTEVSRSITFLTSLSASQS